MYQSERMSCVRVTCLATGNQIYEWSQHIFKNLCKFVFEIFVFKHLFWYIFRGFSYYKKNLKKGKQYLPKI